MCGCKVVVALADLSSCARSVVPDKFADKRKSAVQALRRAEQSPLSPQSPSLSTASSSGGSDAAAADGKDPDTFTPLKSVQRTPLGTLTPQSDYRPAHLTSPFALFPDSTRFSPFTTRSGSPSRSSVWVTHDARGAFAYACV